LNENFEVPKTVLEDIWTETLADLKDNPEFNRDLLTEIKAMVKSGTIKTDDLINILKD
jgi:hypothetical protein